MIGQIAAQERQMPLAPGRNGVIVVAVRHRAANHQQQHLRQGMRHAPSLPGILDDGKMVEERPKTRLLLKNSEGKAHGGGSRISPPQENHAKCNPLTAVNLSSEPRVA